MTTLNIGPAVDYLLRQTDLTGGATVSVTTGQSPDSGYAVSLPGFEYSVQSWTKRSNEALVFAYVDKYRAKLAQPGHYLGSWVHDGRLYLDITRVIPELAQAIKLGREGNQLAIYDIRNERELSLDPDPFVVVHP
jgi:hypothetical protein